MVFSQVNESSSIMRWSLVGNERSESVPYESRILSADPPKRKVRTRQGFAWALYGEQVLRTQIGVVCTVIADSWTRVTGTNTIDFPFYSTLPILSWTRLDAAPTPPSRIPARQLALVPFILALVIPTRGEARQCVLTEIQDPSF